MGVTERRTRDGDARFVVRWVDREGGRRVWRSRTFPDRAAAEDFDHELRTAKRRGTYAAPDDLTVAEVVEEYLARAARRWRPGTTFVNKQRARDYIVPSLGAVRLDRLTTARVQRWVDNLPLAPATVGPIVAVLSGALAEAVRLGLVARNVARGVQVPKIARRPATVWTRAEAAAVLAQATEPRWQAVYQLMLTCGLRPGELRALQWADVDLARGRLRVRRTVAHAAAGGSEVHAGTKRGGGRTVALTLPAMQALRALPRTGVWLWGDAPLAGTTWRTAHARLCAAAGVPVIRLHDLRHVCATLLLERGVHPEVVSTLLGHKGIEVTLNLYSHASTDLLAAAQEGLADWLNAGPAVPSSVRTEDESRMGMG